VIDCLEALKMLDLQKKYAIISYILQVQHQARNGAFSAIHYNHNILCKSNSLFFIAGD